MRYLFLLLCCAAVLAAAPPAPLQTFTVQDHLRQQWTDEIVHFPITYTGSMPKSLTLIGADGKAMPCQVSDLSRKNGVVTGAAWTVVTLPPGGKTVLHLAAGKSAPTALRLQAQGETYLLGNECLTLRLPRFPGVAHPPVALTALPAPLLAVRQAAGDWLCEGRWINDGAPVQVVDAVTTIVENGPVRVTVRQQLTFTDGSHYRMTIQLGARQDAALITEDSTAASPKTAFRLSMQPGLRADRAYWCSNYWREPKKGLTPGEIPPDVEQVICRLCPWSFWSEQDIASWVGLYRADAEPFVGVIALRPSRWSPTGFAGFQRTMIPVTARANGQLDLTFALAADHPEGAAVVPMHREWALTVGKVDEHMARDPKTGAYLTDLPAVKLRRQLVKYSEFPLDEVKEFGFKVASDATRRPHPFLLYSRADIERVRRQAQALPAYQEQLVTANRYLRASGDVDRTLANEGWQAFYTKHYVPGNLGYILARTYLASDDPKYARYLAAAVKGMAAEVVAANLKLPCIGRGGPWVSEFPMRLLLTYDLIAGSGALTPEEEADIEHILVYSAHFLAHPDYWNPDVGLGNSLPNMTSSIRLPLGLLALYLHGHPASAGWLRGAETEIQYEFAHWVSPGGAWIENLQYQSASLDGIFLLAQALKNVTGRDYFADANFKATMDYFGWVLTPPDPQFPPAPWKTAATPSPMTLPALGDGMLGYITAFNGWMAAATAATDPAYSAQQQFFWQGQQQYLGISETARGNDSSGRAKSFTMALMNPELPAAPPTALAKAFPDFGSVMRSSWTDPRASYLLHRVGKQAIHTHMEENSIVYYAKGAPLCLDPGNGPGATAGSQPPWLHNLVSFDTPRAPVVYGPMHGNGTLRELRALGRIVDYSNGESRGVGNQQNLRHLLLVKSDDPLGAIYVVMRDATVDGQANQAFYWNLWCLGREPRIDGTVVHFPGQYGVDLDVHVLAPAQPVINRDHWEWKPGYVYVWGRIDPVLHGVHVQKQGSKEDFFTVLYPRAAGQAAAEVTILAGGAAARVAHMEGVDLVLLSPGKVATAEADGMGMDGEIALARRYTDGRLRLAILKGHAQSAVTIDGWGLASAEPAAIEVHGNTITGESNGAVHVIKIALPPGKKLVTLALDGKGTTGSRNDISYELAVPAGHHSFRLTVE